MAPYLLQRYKTLHLWAGIGTSLLLFVSFLTGALTLFAPELDRWVSPPENPYRQASAAALGAAGDRLIAATLAAHPEAAKSLTVHFAPTAPAPLTWQRGRFDVHPMSARLNDQGEVEFTALDLPRSGHFLDDLHRSGGLPVDRELGAQIMGAVSLFYALALVSGLVLVIPGLAKDFLVLRRTENRKRFWLDAHNLAGVVSLPFHLLIAMTAVVFGWHDEFYAAQNATLYRGQLPVIMQAANPFSRASSEAPNSNVKPADLPPIAQLLSPLQAQAPGFQIRHMELHLAGPARGLARVSGRDPRHLSRGDGFALIALNDGRVVNADYLPGHQEGFNTVVSAFFALHFATFGGDGVRWIYGLLALSGCFLFYSGNLLWLESRRRKAQASEGIARPSPTARYLAALTVGGALGLLAALPLALLGARLAPQLLPAMLEGSAGDLSAQAQTTLFYATWGGMLLWALGRGAARSGVGILYGAALACLSMPLTSLCLKTSNMLPVDVAALIAGLALIALGRRFKQRCQQAAPGSVWSLATGG